MKNITITLDPRTAELSRNYAKRMNTSLSALVKDLLTKLVSGKAENGEWVESFFAEMDQAKGRSRPGESFARADLYRKP